MNVEQKARFDAIKAEIEITMDAFNDGEIDAERIRKLASYAQEGSFQHAAYIACLHIIGY